MVQASAFKQSDDAMSAGDIDKSGDEPAAARDVRSGAEDRGLCDRSNQ